MEWIYTSKKKNAIKDSSLNENLDTIKGGVNNVKDLCLLQSCVASLLYVPF